MGSGPKGITETQILTDVAEALNVSSEVLPPDVDVLDAGLDSIRLMTLVDKWRDAGAEQANFEALASDPVLSSWYALLANGSARGTESIGGDHLSRQRLKTSLATVTLGGTLAEKITAIAEAGFDGIELLTDDLTTEISAAECRRRCAEAGLSIDVFQPFRRAEGVPSEEFQQVSTRFRQALDTMAELESSSILVVSNTDDDADRSRERSVDQIAALGAIAAEYGVTLMYEALAWGTHISRVEHASEVVRSVDSAHVALVVDTFHLLAAQESLDGIALGSIGLVQVADAPWKDLPVKQWSRGYRCFPGEGDFELLNPLAAIVNAGYTGPLSLEIFNPEYREQDPRSVAQRGAQSLNALQQSIAIEMTAANGTAR